MTNTKQTQAVYGDFDTWCEEEVVTQECSERFAKRVTEFIKVSKNCGFEAGCFSDEPLLFTDDNSDGIDNFVLMLMNSVYMVALSDGLSLGFQYGAANRYNS